jgi:hypothetical protein
MTDPIMPERAPARNQLLYILKSGSGLIKVGISYDPEQRLRSLMTGHPFELEVAYVVEFEALAAARFSSEIPLSTSPISSAQLVRIAYRFAAISPHVDSSPTSPGRVDKTPDLRHVAPPRGNHISLRINC